MYLSDKDGEATDIMPSRRAEEAKSHGITIYPIIISLVVS